MEIIGLLVVLGLIYLLLHDNIKVSLTIDDRVVFSIDTIEEDEEEETPSEQGE